jgi:hypothetical protein
MADPAHLTRLPHAPHPGILSIVPSYGPYTDSDLAEDDDFVRSQLLLVHALEIGFKCKRDPVTVFRDDLLGLGLLRVEGSESGPHAGSYVMQALCHRISDHSQWRVMDFSPAWAPRSRWISYEGIGQPDLGVVVETVPADTEVAEGSQVVTVHDVTYQVRWDVPRMSA